jgi:hypothetical protein
MENRKEELKKTWSDIKTWVLQKVNNEARVCQLVDLWGFTVQKCSKLLALQHKAYFFLRHKQEEG